MKSGITAMVLLLLSPILLAEDKTEDFHCPLTAEYLLLQLERMENLPITPNPNELEPLKEHAIRMAGEVLENAVFENEKECEYFFISVKLLGLESKKRVHRITFYDELMAYVQSCKSWVAERFPDPKEELSSVFCN